MLSSEERTELDGRLQKAFSELGEIYRTLTGKGSSEASSSPANVKHALGWWCKASNGPQHSKCPGHCIEYSNDPKCECSCHTSMQSAKLFANSTEPFQHGSLLC